MTDRFNNFIRFSTDRGDRFYLKSRIDEENNTMEVQLTDLTHCWTGKLDREQIRVMAKKFPNESHDSFYSHTQRAFSSGKQDARTYVFDCPQSTSNRLELIWKEKVNDLNSLKTIGSIQLDKQANAEVLRSLFDYAIDQIEHQRSINTDKSEELQRTNTQLTKAIETIQRTVDLKERLESDLFRKFSLVLNEKKSQLAQLKRQLESTTDHHSHVEEITQSTATATLDPLDESNSKRAREENSDTDEEATDVHSKLRRVNREDSALDLGDDRRDYKASTIEKHHQRRRPSNSKKTISTRPFVHATSLLPTPSLPDESQTTDDWLNRI